MLVEWLAFQSPERFDVARDCFDDVAVTAPVALLAKAVLVLSDCGCECVSLTRLLDRLALVTVSSFLDFARKLYRFREAIADGESESESDSRPVECCECVSELEREAWSESVAASASLFSASESCSSSLSLSLSFCSKSALETSTEVWLFERLRSLLTIALLASRFLDLLVFRSQRLLPTDRTELPEISAFTPEMAGSLERLPRLTPSESVLLDDALL